jgi:hypothetical protein
MLCFSCEVASINKKKVMILPLTIVATTSWLGEESTSDSHDPRGLDNSFSPRKKTKNTNRAGLQTRLQSEVYLTKKRYVTNTQP